MESSSAIARSPGVLAFPANSSAGSMTLVRTDRCDLSVDLLEPVAVLRALGVHLTDGVNDRVRLVEGNIFRALVRE
jgi:hypothetical protein